MGKFKFTETDITGLLVIEPTIYEDHRGYFMETYNERDFAAAGLNTRFIQENQSLSAKGVLRGLHFQYNHPQAKLVRVLKGTVQDVVVDLRRVSPTFRRWYGVILSDENKKMLYIPEGFAHGFLVLSEMAVLSYKCNDFYHPEDEGGLLWNDPDIAIQWQLDGIEEVILSEKDQKNKKIYEIENLLNFSIS